MIRKPAITTTFDPAQPIRENTTARAPNARIALRFARDWLVPQWRWFALGVLLSLVAAGGAYAYAEITRRAFDWLAVRDPRVLWLTPGTILFAALLRGGAVYAQTQANNVGVQRAMVRLQDALFGALANGDYARLHSAASGSYVSQFTNDMNLVRESALRVATNLAKSSFTVAGALTFMFVTDWTLAVLVVVVYPLAFYPVVRLGDRIRRSSRRAQEQAGEMTSLLGEAFLGARTMKAYSLEDWQRRRAHDAFVDRSRLYMKVLRSKAIVDPFLEVVGGVALAGLFAFAGWRTLTGHASAGELIGFVTALATASPEVRALGTLNSVVGEGLAAAERVYSVVDAIPDIREFACGS